MKRRSTFLLTCLVFGYAFFYIPIMSMMFFSFNNARLATVWGGFSTKWYGVLFSNQAVLKAAWLSLEIAAVSATIATILGTLSGLALARFTRFRGRTLFSGLVSAPLVMPEAITGISMLLLFVFMGTYLGWPANRGFTTITIAHTTFALSYVAVVVQSRLASMDQSIEEAAMDLGSKPLQVLFDVTFPIIAPAIVSGEAPHAGNAAGGFGGVVSFILLSSSPRKRGPNIPGDGILLLISVTWWSWVPAFAGMTNLRY
jgi:putrescine transport system permease protein